MTLQEYIDKAVLQAKIGLDPQSVPTRLDLVANSLLGQVFGETARSFPDFLQRTSKTITFANGVGMLASDVLTANFDTAVLYDPNNPENEYAYVPYWEDFIRVYDTRMGYFTVIGTSIYVIEPGSTYEDGNGLDGDLILKVAGVPSIPASASTAISASGEFLNRALDRMVERLKGAIPEEA